MGSRKLTVHARRLLPIVATLLAVFPQAGITQADFWVGDEANIEKFAIRRLQPSYPPNAQKYRIEGIVTVQVAVGSDGKVTKAEFVRGNNVFRSVSLDAAKRWEFQVTSGSSLEGMIRFTFKLNNE